MGGAMPRRRASHPRRLGFVARLLYGEKMAPLLCRKFGMSSITG
jgi:hypothetical protein